MDSRPSHLRGHSHRNGVEAKSCHWHTYSQTQTWRTPCIDICLTYWPYDMTVFTSLVLQRQENPYTLCVFFGKTQKAFQSPKIKAESVVCYERATVQLHFLMCRQTCAWQSLKSVWCLWFATHETAELRRNVTSYNRQRCNVLFPWYTIYPRLVNGRSEEEIDKSSSGNTIINPT